MRRHAGIDRATYEIGIARLIARVREVHEIDHSHSWTPRPRAYEQLAEKADEFAELMAEFEGTDAEYVFDRLDEAEQIGLDGWPVSEPEGGPEPGRYQGLKWRIRELADAARLAGKRLPGPRTKQALPIAARGLLHLWNDCGFSEPVLSDGSEIVGELNRVCCGAGIFLSRERLRGALAESLATFDRHEYGGFDLILYRR
jgi:hypothetical protein